MTRQMLLALAVLLTPTLARADDSAKVSVESNPGTFVLFRGFELGVGLRMPERAPHIRVRLMVDHEHIPQSFINVDDRDTGWHVSDTFGSVNADYVFGSGRGGFHAGLALAVGRVHLTAPMSGSSTDITRMGSRIGVGYQWYPFKHNGFYVDPWLFAIVSPFGNTTSVGMETFHQPVVIAAASLQIGYEL